MKKFAVAFFLCLAPLSALASPYRLTGTASIVREADGAVIPADPRNADYQQYQAWLSAGNVPDPYIAQAVVPTSVQVNSTSTPAISGNCAFDPVTQSKVMAIALYIQVNGKFPAGQTTFPWPDSSGTMHSFTSTAQFQSLATALADYATALAIGQTPTAPAPIP